MGLFKICEGCGEAVSISLFPRVMRFCICCSSEASKRKRGLIEKIRDYYNLYNPKIFYIKTSARRLKIKEVK